MSSMHWKTSRGLLFSRSGSKTLGAAPDYGAQQTGDGRTLQHRFIYGGSLLGHHVIGARTSCYFKRFQLILKLAVKSALQQILDSAGKESV